MHRLLIFLLFATAFGAKLAADLYEASQEYDEINEVAEDIEKEAGTPQYRRRRLGNDDDECQQDKDKDEREFCPLYRDTRERELVVTEARYALAHDCDPPGEIIMLTREGEEEGVAYVTETPNSANMFKAMMDFYRDQHPEIDDLHNLILSYVFTTRDGKSRTLKVTNDMDLWSAIQLQKRFAVTELTVTIDTAQPSVAPTTPFPTRHPGWTAAPTKSPTLSIQSKIVTSEAARWLIATMKSRTNMKVGSLLYRMSTHGKASSYFHKLVDGKGKHICMVKRSKVSNYQLFGSYSDMSWGTGGYGTCSGCYIWIWDDGKYQKFISTVRRYAQYTVYRNSSYGPCFGGAHDYCISSPGTPSGYSSIGYTWWAPNKGYPYYFGGSSTFYIEDWECFSTVSISG